MTNLKFQSKGGENPCQKELFVQGGSLFSPQATIAKSFFGRVITEYFYLKLDDFPLLRQLA
mgnify:CR=1